MRVGKDELRARAREAAEQYRHCLLCAHRCGVDRTRGPAGRCQEGSSVFLAGAGLHFGEEPPLVGTRGSGLVLIAGCNLACAGCETAEFSMLRRGVIRFGEDQLAASISTCRNTYSNSAYTSGARPSCRSRAGTSNSMSITFCKRAPVLTWTFWSGAAATQ